MWRKWSSCLLLCLCLLCCLAAGPCDAEKVGDTAAHVHDITANLAPFVPPPFQWIVAAISLAASTVASVAYGIKKVKEVKAMRSGIEAVGKVIDRMESSKDPEVRAARVKVGQAFKVAKVYANPGLDKDIRYVDAVRLGLK